MCELDDVFIFSTWRETTYNITQFIPQLHEIKKTQLIGFISPTIKKTQLKGHYFTNNKIEMIYT